MIQKITDYLDLTTAKFPDKVAFVYGENKVTFRELKDCAYQIAAAIMENTVEEQVPVAIFLDKGIETISSMMGAAYSRNFYTIIDADMPTDRIQTVVNSLSPKVIITDRRHRGTFDEISHDGKVMLIEDLITCEINENQRKSVEKATDSVISTDILYVLFTSGSTGIPKGTVISHGATIAFTEWFSEAFGVNESFVFGNQVPFYFSMSVVDVYQCISKGCTVHIIPKMYFSMPVVLLEYMNDNGINTVYWVPTALCIVANLNALPEIHVKALQRVIFAGEVMPVKQLNMWIREYPDVKFANLYGPTEVTDICNYYVVDREFDESETIPIGKSCEHMNTFILDADGKEITEVGVSGELCAKGPSLAYGYYGNKGKTAEAFVQNPLNDKYPEVIYRTGDIVRYNDRMELEYVSRKDFQIKHMGHRIELGEIEATLSGVNDVERVCCLYDQKNTRIVAFYVGNVSADDLSKVARTKLVNYMVPGLYRQLDSMPINANGKIDRKKLNEIL